MVQCGAVWCSVVQCGAVRCSVVQCGAVWCSVMQCGAAWCSAVQCGAVWCSVGVRISCLAALNRQCRVCPPGGVLCGVQCGAGGGGCVSTFFSKI